MQLDHVAEHVVHEDFLRLRPYTPRVTRCSTPMALQLRLDLMDVGHRGGPHGPRRILVRALDGLGLPIHAHAVDLGGTALGEEQDERGKDRAD
jgi:hypothetical protein